MSDITDWMDDWGLDPWSDLPTDFDAAMGRAYEEYGGSKDGKGSGGGGRDGKGGKDGRDGKGGKGDGKPKPKPGEPKPSPYTGADSSATAIIEQTLASYGLGELASWAWERHKAGDSIAEIMLKMRSQPAYIERFPAMAELGQRGLGISEGQYIQYERAVANLSAKYGIPGDIYSDRQAVARLMLNDLSPVEIEQNMARVAGVVYGRPEIRQAFAQFYGADGDGAAIAFFLDPDAAQPKLEQQYAAVQIAGNALAQGLNVSKAEAERIAVGASPTEAEAQRAAVVAGTQRELFANLLGERGGPTAGQGISAALGADAADVAAVERRRSERRAQYAEGGSFASGAAGVSGLGSATR